jgi:hypothetical protein
MVKDEGAFPRWIIEHSHCSAALTCPGCMHDMYFSTWICELCSRGRRVRVNNVDDSKAVKSYRCSVRWPCRIRRFFAIVHSLDDDKFEQHLLFLTSVYQCHREYFENIEPTDLDQAIERVTTARRLIKDRLAR